MRKPRLRFLPERLRIVSLPGISRGIIVLLAVVVFTGMPLLAADVESWNEVNFQFWNKGRFALRAKGVLRLRDHLSDPYDSRAGAELRFAANRRVTLVFAYVAREVEYAKSQFDLRHRLTTGGEYSLGSWRSGALRGHTLYEQDMSVSAGHGINRLRQGAQFEVPRLRVSPWFYEEMAFSSGQGFGRNRARIGIVWRLANGRASLHVGYQNQQLEGSAGWVQTHAVFTQLNLTR